MNRAPSLILVNILLITLCGCARTGVATPAARPHSAADSAADRLYVEAVELRQAARRKSLDAARTDLRAAIAKLEAAVARSPNSARALGALAELRLNLNIQDSAGLRASRELMQRALAISPDVAEARSVLGWQLFLLQFRYEDARRAFERALALDSTNTFARWGYGQVLGALGQLDRGIAEAERAEDTGVVNPGLRWGSAALRYFARDYAHAAARAEQPRPGSLNPDYFWLGLARLALDDVAGAVTVLEQRVNQSQRILGAVAVLAQAYEAAGERAKARALREELVARAGGGAPFYRYAAAFLAAGDTEGAFHWLERAVNSPDAWQVWLNVDPTWAPLRADARFANLLRRSGHLPPSQ